jgi:hypothetical protein
MASHVGRAKTSTEIFEEHNALQARVGDLEDAIALIRRETEHGLRHPEACVLALCRIDTVARGVTTPLPIEAPPMSSIRAKTIARSR